MRFPKSQTLNPVLISKKRTCKLITTSKLNVDFLLENKASQKSRKSVFSVWSKSLQAYLKKKDKPLKGPFIGELYPWFQWQYLFKGWLCQFAYWAGDERLCRADYSGFFVRDFWLFKVIFWKVQMFEQFVTMKETMRAKHQGRLTFIERL